jgi:hypothetical protein
MVSGKVVDTVFDPEVPISLTVEFANFAVLPAVSVSRLVPVVGFGEKDALTPLGNPESERLTLPRNPYSGVTVTFAGVEVPDPRFTVSGPAKVNAGATTSIVNVVFAVCAPLTPVTVNVLIPTGAESLAFKVSAAVPVTGFGEIEVVTPLGSPETARPTLPAKPYSGFTEIEVELEDPCPRVIVSMLLRVNVGT